MSITSTNMKSTQILSTMSIDSALAPSRARARRIGLAVTIGWAIACGAAALLVAAWADLVVDLPGAVRFVCLLVAAGIGIVMLVRLGRFAFAKSSTTEVAKRADAIAGARGQVQAGVDLANADSGKTGAVSLSTDLARMAIARAAQIAGAVSPAMITPAKPLAMPMSVLGAGLLFVLIFAVASPRMFATQWLRFTDPFGDHPPYSPLVFTVEPGNGKVLFGGAFDVRATVTGGVAERVELVLDRPADTEAAEVNESLPMFPEGQGGWRATIADVTQPGTYFLRSGKARSARFQLGVITVPQLADVRFRVTLPAYTKRPPYDGPLPQNGLTGLPGTTVQITAKSNRPLSGGTLTFAPSGEVATTKPTNESPTAFTPIAENGSEVAGSFVIHHAGKLTIGVTDVAGQPSTATLTAPVNVLADARPFVRMIDPKPNSFATPDAVIKAVVSAEDDYGISSVKLYRGVNGTRPRPIDLSVPTSDGPVTQVPSELVMKLADFGLKPGDVLQMFARVEDNDPAGVKGSESPVVYVRIVSHQDMDRMQLAREGMEVLQSKYAAAERQLEALGAKLDKTLKELEKLDPKSELAEKMRKEIEQFAADIEAAAKEIEKLANRDLPFDIDNALSQKLKDAVQKVQEAADEAKKASKPGIGGVVGAKEHLEQARKKLGAERQKINEEANQPLEHLAKIFPLMQDQAVFLDIHARQKDLAQRMKDLNEAAVAGDDPKLKARMRDLEAEQQQIRRDLSQLMDDIENHLAALPPDPQLDDLRKTAKDFRERLAESPAETNMLMAESALQDFAGASASASAQSASDELEKLITQCNGMGENAQACLKFQPTLSAGLGNTIEQMLQSMSLSTGTAGHGVGGYSAARNSLANVGLYGTIPTRASESGSGNGQADRGTSSRAGGDLPDATNPDNTGAAGAQHASGQGDAPVPQAYKKRVGDYFRRVADELE